MSTTISITDKDLPLLLGVMEIGYYVILEEMDDDGEHCSNDYFDGSRGKGYDSIENFKKTYEAFNSKMLNASKRIRKDKKKKEKKKKKNTD
jgi:hypothetical protein